MGLRGRYVTLLNEVAKRRPSTILEIGTHCGNSAIRMVDEAKNITTMYFIMVLMYLIGAIRIS